MLIIDKIKDIKDDIEIFYYRVIHVVTSTYAYFIYVCKNGDYDWDYSYILSIINWKLKKMEKAFKDDTILVNSHRYYRQIKYANYLLERYNNPEQFTKEQTDYLDNTYGKTEYDFEPYMHNGKEYYKFKSFRKKAKPEDKELIYKLEKEIYEKEEKIQDDAIKRYFNFIGRNFRKWWI